MRKVHPLSPIYKENSKILILGSFPSEISRKENFYYANKTNRFWKIMEELFKIKLNSKEEKINFLFQEKIALWDVISSCEIEKSKDNSIKKVIPNDIEKLIKNSQIKTIFVTGKAALKYYNKYIKDKLEKEAIYLPSTSGANATYSFDKLIKYYQKIKNNLN